MIETMQATTMTGAARPAPKVLVVDDTPVNVKLLGDLLGIKGYAVTTAQNGEEALAKSRASYASCNASTQRWSTPRSETRSASSACSTWTSAGS